MELASGVYVRAKDSSGRWGASRAEDLDERSFRVFILTALAKVGVVVAITDEAMAPKEYTTNVLHVADGAT